MGTKGSFAGGGGKIGDDLREGIDDWLDNLPGGSGDGASPSGGDGAPKPNDASQPPNQTGKPGTSGGANPRMSPAAQRVLPTALLFRTSSGSGSRARKGTSVQFPRSAATTSRSAGRGAAAAYAYRIGDAQTLRDIGLDYEVLRSNPDVIDVVHQIVQKVCEDLPPGEIDTEEQTHVVAEIAGWVITTDPDAAVPSPEEIAVETLATVLKWAYLTTTAAEMNTKDMTGPQRVAFEKEIRAACEEVAAQANLSTTGTTGAEFSEAIESGIEYLQHIYEAGDQWTISL